MKLSAKIVQEMFGVKDGECVAYGYTFDRRSVVIWFDKGRIKRAEYKTVNSQRDGEVSLLELRESDTFQPEYFSKQIKRWYADAVNENVSTFFETFGAALVTTPGGLPPRYWPDENNNPQVHSID